MAVNFPAPGIYMNMPEDIYHATGALGSTSIKQLSWSAPDYWFSSPHNPVEIEADTNDAFTLGSAFHKIVLEGREAFEARYGVAYENGTTKLGRAESEAIAAAGKIRVRFKDWQRILLAGAAIGANPHLANAFQGGPTEVSIFWNHPVGGGEPVPLKARIDCLKLRSSTDLKTIAPIDGMEFDAACKRAMGSYSYHVQARHYENARRQMSKLLADGCIFGDHDADLMKRIAAQDEFASVFVFLKKTAAPLTHGIMLSPGNPLLGIAQATIDKAVDNYVRCRSEFGFDTPWLVNKPLEELAAEELPPWAFR